MAIGSTKTIILSVHHTTFYFHRECDNIWRDSRCRKKSGNGKCNEANVRQNCQLECGGCSPTSTTDNPEESTSSTTYPDKIKTTTREFTKPPHHPTTSPEYSLSTTSFEFGDTSPSSEEAVSGSSTFYPYDGNHTCVGKNSLSQIYLPQRNVSIHKKAMEFKIYK